MMITSEGKPNLVFFSKKHDNWSTPDYLFDKLNSIFNFDYDPCPLYSDYDGISTEWGNMNFVNPPYSNIEPFLSKAVEIYLNQGKQSVFLLPARTDTKWFHEYVLKYATSIEFLRGRLRFGGSTQNAPFPSLIVYFIKNDTI